MQPWLIGGRMAANRLASTAHGNDPKLSLQAAHTLLQAAFQRAMLHTDSHPTTPGKPSSPRATPSSSTPTAKALELAQSRRMLVTEPTYQRLHQIVGEQINPRSVGPYQESGLCELHALTIMRGRQEERQRLAERAAPPSTWQWLQGLANRVVGEAEAREALPADAAGLLAKFRQHGIFCLRGIGIADPSSNYRDHAVLVFSVNQIAVPGAGTKTVVGVLDCNDDAEVPENQAAAAIAKAEGKSHLSEISHAQAEQAGAHLRRIRFMDADGLLKHVQACHAHHASPRTLPPVMIPPKQPLPLLEPEQMRKLEQLLLEIYPTAEVEKFDKPDPRHFERDTSSSPQVETLRQISMYQ